MNSSDKLTVDDFTTVFVPLTVSDIKYLRDVFESWVVLIGKPNEKVQYLYRLLGLMIRSLDLVSSLPSSSENGEVSVH